MVRRGSTVRVRQRALTEALHMQGFCCLNSKAPLVGGYDAGTRACDWLPERRPFQPHSTSDSWAPDTQAATVNATADDLHHTATISTSGRDHSSHAPSMMGSSSRTWAIHS
jgi:hypothetical protein